MGDYRTTPTDACPADHGPARDRGQPFGRLCDLCYSRLINETDNRQAIEEGATAALPHCPDCELRQDRYKTGYDRYVLLEPGYEPPAHTVPVGQRWIVRADGRAVNTGDTEPPLEAVCRIPHRLVCPCGPPPTHPTLKALWDYNSGLTPCFNPPAAETG
ncbi:DUF6083 domain-containing protein [Streptomyces netropsis]|uniref:Uncharacterized protein n=1 Tax=Streptomyces netropsis TaxID=55404 RepID=A0A7W7LE19_STRNE|nr:DUF6083 domain-containing protein [Streptomyces netropsis]MBB4887953.1 hypothetical protein [Streptomyces netropsis]GGR33105.1 hypothetical protein GCM10010219_42540 [Streptomyces netropsis]